LRPDDEIRREVIDDVMHRMLWLMPEEAGVRVEVTDGVVSLEGWLERRASSKSWSDSCSAWKAS